MTLKPWSGRGTRRPGEFQAYCRHSHWTPLDELLARPREEQPDTTQTRWDPKLKCEVALVQCDFETADRDAFTEHMRSVHGGGLFRWDSPSLDPAMAGTSVRRYIPRMGGIPVKLSKGPTKGSADGRPFKPSTKALASTVETCKRCGLVAEVGGPLAEQLWWDEHLRLCSSAAVA